MSLKEKRIGVMMGGLSAEKEISLKSGRAVFEALKSLGLHVVLLEVTSESEEEIRRLVNEAAVDVVFIVMHGGFGEDGRLQRMLDNLSLPYTGPQEQSSRRAMDKVVSRAYFKKAKLRVPRSRLWKRGMPVFWATLFLQYPVVVKPPTQGSSIGISFVNTTSQLRAALDLALTFGPEVLIEEFIKGREVTVSVLDGRALPIVEIVSKNIFFDYEAKYRKGLTEYIVPAQLSEDVTRRVQKDALTAYQVLGCRHLSRVDMILTDGGTPYVLEVNTIPGMTETSLLPKAAKAAGISFQELCLQIVQTACAGSERGKK